MRAVHGAIAAAVAVGATLLVANPAYGGPSPATPVGYVGVLGSDGTLLVKEGLHGTWRSVYGGVKKFALEGDRIAVLDSGGAVHAKDGLDASWHHLTSPGWADVQLEGNRIGVLGSDGSLIAKDGLDGSWHSLYGGVKKFDLEGDRIAVLDSGGAVHAKDGLDASWHHLTSPGWVDVQLEGNRIGVLGSDGTLIGKEGLDTGWTGLFGGAAAFDLEGDRIGVLGRNAVAYAKDGMHSPWTTLTDPGIAQLQLAGDRIGVLTTGGALYAKDGLHTGWHHEYGGVKSFDLDSDRIAVLDSAGVLHAKDGLVGGWSTLTGAGFSATQLTHELTGAAPPAVIWRDFPDPDLLRVGGTWYAYSTNSGYGRLVNVPVATSPSLSGPWAADGVDALPNLPGWVRYDSGTGTYNVWAPEVTRRDDGSYIMYFTARHYSGLQCIGAATSGTPAGPFTPVGTQPLICNSGDGGDIDATAASIDGRHFLLYKSNAAYGGPSRIWLHEVASNGISWIGSRYALVSSDGDEHGVVEAPTLVRRNGQYVLLYSANPYTSNYQVRYAVAGSVTGPYTKQGTVVSTATWGGAIVNPGGQDVVTGPDGDYLVFHGNTGGGRGMFVTRLTW